mgnify:CR=1 FL=1
MPVSVTDGGGTLIIADGNSTINPNKKRVVVTSFGTTVRIGWDEVGFVSYPATDFTAPTGTATQIQAAIQLLLDTGI